MEKAQQRSIICLLLITVLLIAAFRLFPALFRTSDNRTVSKSDFYFDTVITITLYNGNEDLIDECFVLCDKYEQLFSKTISDSEIAQINQNSMHGNTTAVSDETMELIQYGLHYSDLSNGVFDITIGNLSALWNFDDNSEGVLPDDREIQAAVSDIGYEQVQTGNQEVFITNPNTSIDLGGIAKGYIADRLKEYLLENGVKSGIINLGGNVLLIGSKPDKTNYHIGIQRPFGSQGDTSVIINDRNISIVTSGIYERYFSHNDKIYHHILDIKTGYPVQNNLYSVTILSEHSVDGDGLSTTAFALGLEEGKKFIEAMDNVEAVFIANDETITVTSGLTVTDGIVNRKQR